MESVDHHLQHLSDLPFVRDISHVADGRGREDAAGTLEVTLVDGAVASLTYEVKSSHLGAAAAEHLHVAEGPSVLFAPYVGAPLGDALERRGINFVDRVGNCHVRIGDQHIARIQGRAAPKVPARSKEMRAPGYQVMFALLAEPELVGESQREIAAAAGTSRQPVMHLLSRFVEERVLVRDGRRHQWVRPPDGALLTRWVEGYRMSLRPRLVVGRFRVPAQGPEAVESWLQARLDDVRFGGVAGAHRLVGHYRSPETVAHLGPPSEEIRRQLKALAAPDGDLVWMRHIGSTSAKGATADSVHPLLLYGELMADPDPRAGEQAGLVRERSLTWSL